MMEDRNLVMHTYDETRAREIHGHIKKTFPNCAGPASF